MVRRADGLTVPPLALVLEGRFHLLQFWWAFGRIIVYRWGGGGCGDTEFLLYSTFF